MSETVDLYEVWDLVEVDDEMVPRWHQYVDGVLVDERTERSADA